MLKNIMFWSFVRKINNIKGPKPRHGCVRIFPSSMMKFILTNGRLMKIESIAERSPWNILQYYWSCIKREQVLKNIFWSFESDRFKQLNGVSKAMLPHTHDGFL